MSYGTFHFKVCSNANDIFQGSQFNDVALYAPTTTQNIYIGSSNASNVLVVSQSNVTVSRTLVASNVYSSNMYSGGGTFSNGTFSNGNFPGTFSGSGALLTGVPTTGIAGTVGGVLQVAQGGTGSSATATGTGAVVLNNAPTFVGTVTAGTFSGAHSGNGAALTSIPITGVAGTVGGVLQVAQGGTGSSCHNTRCSRDESCAIESFDHALNPRRGPSSSLLHALRRLMVLPSDMA